MYSILFQGDSITDAGRDRADPDSLGSGYARIAAARLERDCPGRFRARNLAVSGDRSVDLYARLQRDILDRRPDILSLLIGVNDVWHDLDFHSGVTAEDSARTLDALLRRVRTELPETRILLLEPFVLEGSGTRAYYGAFRRRVEALAEMNAALARQYGLRFVPLQDRMDRGAARGVQVLSDGVHPNLAGHELIADELYAAVRELTD